MRDRRTCSSGEENEISQVGCQKFYIFELNDVYIKVRFMNAADIEKNGDELLKENAALKAEVAFLTARLTDYSTKSPVGQYAFQEARFEDANKVNHELLGKVTGYTGRIVQLERDKRAIKVQLDSKDAQIEALYKANTVLNNENAVFKLGGAIRYKEVLEENTSLKENVESMKGRIEALTKCHENMLGRLQAVVKAASGK